MGIADEIEKSDSYLSHRDVGQMRARAGWPVAFTEDEDLTLQWLNHHLWRVTREDEMAQILTEMLQIQMRYFTKEELIGKSPLSVSEVIDALPQSIPAQSGDEDRTSTLVCRSSCFLCFPQNCEYLMPPDWIPLPGGWRTHSRQDPTKTYMSAILKDLTPVKRLLDR
jgi:hypothetical protein